MKQYEAPNMIKIDLFTESVLDVSGGDAIINKGDSSTTVDLGKVDIFQNQN